MSDLFTEGQEKMKILDQTLSDLGRRGKAYAQAEKDYRMALAKKILVARDRGKPTTILLDVCRGDENVADLKFHRDCAEAYYKTCLEGINVLKLEIKMLESQLDREYNRK
jgi:hypothetical protein